MNPPSMEAIFLILSGAILMAGILYWLWSHIQLTQKKVLLIENSVHELRDILSKRVATPAPEPIATVYNDFADDDWVEEVDTTTTPMVSTPLDDLDQADVVVTHLEQNNSSDTTDLQPGGRILSGDEKEFRELFAARTPDENSAPANSSLESMSVKELRRIAEQRGITKAGELRKRELLVALRDQSTITNAGSLDGVFVERVIEEEAVPVLE